MKPYDSFEELTGEKEMHCLMLTYESEDAFIQNTLSYYLKTSKTVYLYYKEI